MKSQVIRETDRWNISHFLLSHLNILQLLNRILTLASLIQAQQCAMITDPLPFIEPNLPGNKKRNVYQLLKE